MRVLVILVFWLLGCLSAKPGIDPVPESAQAAAALKIIDAYHGARPAIPPKLLHVVYFTPSDRDPAPRYRERLNAILEDIRAFYRDGMVRCGFGPETFNLARDPQGHLIIHFVKGKEPANDYQKSDGDMVFGECREVLAAAGIYPERETVLIFCNLADWDPAARTFSHHSPYHGTWTQTNGLCFVVDSVILDLDNIRKDQPILKDDEYGEMSLGKFNSIFIGGIAHELGHAFGLQHCAERWDEKPLGTSLMGLGNHTYRNELRGAGKGAFLTMASAMSLAARPIFSGSDKGNWLEKASIDGHWTPSTQVTRADLLGRRGGLRLEGTITGVPPVYAVIAYFNSVGDAGYESPTATAVPDAEGRFALEISDLAPTDDGDVRIEFCRANGAVTERHLGLIVDPQGRVDLTQPQIRKALEPLASAVADNQVGDTANALRALEVSDAPEQAKLIGRQLAATLGTLPKPIPATVPASVSRLALGDAEPESAEVGWLAPAANRIPLESGISSPLLDSGRVYATGLYAHAPSKYVFNLDGKWNELSGTAGLHTDRQAIGSVIFIIKADDREVFRSGRIESARKARYQVNLAGVKKLQLIVEPAANNNSWDWALWLDPTLSR